MDDALIEDLLLLPEDIPRTAREVAERCVVLLAIVAAGHGADRSELIEWLQLEDVGWAVSPDEVELFESGSPTEPQMIHATWRAEALWALLWALGKVANLPTPIELCSLDEMRQAMPDVFTATGEFLRTAELRSEEEVEEVREEVYQAQWTVRDAQLNDRPIPDGHNPGIIQERHYALNWLIGYMGQAWDDITTDT